MKRAREEDTDDFPLPKRQRLSLDLAASLSELSVSGEFAPGDYSSAGTDLDSDFEEEGHFELYDGDETPFFGPGAYARLGIDRTVTLHSEYIWRRLDEASRDALYAYTSSTAQVYAPSNEALRRRILDAVLDRPHPGEYATLYSFQNPRSGTLGADSWEQDRFTSATYDRNFSGEAFSADLQAGGTGEACCLLVIGTDEGLCVESVSAYPQQREVLLPPGRFSVSHVETREVSFYRRTLSYAWKPIRRDEGGYEYDEGMLDRRYAGAAVELYGETPVRERYPIMRDVTAAAAPQIYTRQMRVVYAHFQARRQGWRETL